MELNRKIAIGLSAMVLFVAFMAVLQVAYPSAVIDMPVGKATQLDETFNRSDFIYGTQAWKPYITATVPIVEGQDPKGSDKYYAMFVDLYATPYGIDDTGDYTGGVKVEYSFTNLTGLAAFNVYGFSTHSNNLGNTPGIFMANQVSPSVARHDSAYYVYGNSTLSGAPMPSTQSLGLNLFNVKIANNEGPAFDVNGNGTYPFVFTHPGGGLNPLHFTLVADSNKRTDYGVVTFTHDQSGVFYISDTGGAGISDAILMVAVNGTQPDTFSLHLKASMINNRSLFE